MGKKEPTREEKDLAFMSDPMQWPYMVLPVKKSGFGRVGVMFDQRPRVYTVSIYELTDYKEVHPDEIPHTDYTDLQAVVDDGWRVD